MIKLEWLYRLPLDAAIEWTVDWFEADRGSNGAAAITTARFERYTPLIAPDSPAVRTSLVLAQTKPSVGNRQ